MNVIKITGSFKDVRFWNALKIYYQEPKSINKEILFSESLFVADLQLPLTVSKCQRVVDDFDSKLSTEWCLDDFIDDFRKNEVLSEIRVLKSGNCRSEEVENVFLQPNKIHLFVRKVIPKISDEVEFFEFIFLDKITATAYFLTKSFQKTSCEGDKTKKLDPFPILKFNFLKLICCEKHLEISYDNSLGKKGVAWLHATFAPKFEKLLLNFDTYKVNNKNSNNLEFSCKVDIIQYYKFYEKLKLKYGKYFVENWTENTDPKKFVYEDIGIATYLLMLWNNGNVPEEGSKKQRFVDLGCGNGLLVHILNSEGHLGIGLDLRKRKIWDIYPPTTVLEEKVILPTKQTIYPEADWLIGNHSDELTAWIPIMARLSNSHCQYFVLPCCPYQLNGHKFQRKNSGLSSYQDFINYVMKISKLCGFETSVDKLRIPSTKRICLLGLNEPEILEEKYSSLKDEIYEFIEKECSDEKSENQVTALSIKVRESVDPVRNCTKLPQELIDCVLKAVMTELLKSKNISNVIWDGKMSTWNRGGMLPIGELASCLNKNVLKQLKSECKGLQTLLKNHHFLFEVSQGFVQFRSPASMEELSNKFLETQSETKWKLKKCWFFHNHPDKCPLSDVVCSYSHNKKN